MAPLSAPGQRIFAGRLLEGFDSALRLCTASCAAWRPANVRPNQTCVARHRNHLFKTTGARSLRLKNEGVLDPGSLEDMRGEDGSVLRNLITKRNAFERDLVMICSPVVTSACTSMFFNSDPLPCTTKVRSSLISDGNQGARETLFEVRWLWTEHESCRKRELRHE
jgi:hypothetical protein